MLKVCSFLPAVTQMLYDMGLQDHIFGVTFECPETALREKQPIVHCILEGKNLSSKEIDSFFSKGKNEGKKLYYVDEVALAEIAPDIIFTQDTCDVCQIDTACTERAIARLPKEPKLVSISHDSLSDVFENAMTIGKVLGKEEVANAYVRGLKNRIEALVDGLRANMVPPKRVMLMEWIDPIYNCGHWIPHQIGYAGGIDMLSNPSGNSMVTPWEKVLKYDPEILIVAPCGFTIKRTFEEMYLLTERQGWNGLSAVRNDKVFITDFDLFTQSSASTLVDGIELLAGLFHPGAIEIPKYLRGKCRKYHRQEAYL